jgi:4-hydroxy-2-oxoheptanedioate aldolase
MKLRQSRLLRELRAGHCSTTLKLNMNDPRIVELAGLSGASAVWLCNEHVPNDWLNLEHQVRAAKLHDMDTIVRISKGGYSEYVKPFELDATGIMVPMVNTADEARRVVEMTRFHPLGKRAMDGGNMDGIFCQLPTVEYVAHTNAERFLVLQIETPEGLANAEEIAAVPGYDILLFGPGDFSHQIGKPGQTNAPEVVEARRKVAAIGRKQGKFMMTPGMLAPRPDLEKEGFQIFNLGADVISLGGAFNKLVADFHGTAPAAKSESFYGAKS